MKEKKAKRRRKPSPQTAALLEIAYDLRVMQRNAADDMVAARQHEERYHRTLLDISISLQELVPELRSVRHEIYRLEGVSSAIYNVARELKPPPSWWVRWRNRLQVWWWNRKMRNEAAKSVDVVADAVQKHDDKLKDEPTCGRWN